MVSAKRERLAGRMQWWSPRLIEELEADNRELYRRIAGRSTTTLPTVGAVGLAATSLAAVLAGVVFWLTG